MTLALVLLVFLSIVVVAALSFVLIDRVLYYRYLYKRRKKGRGRPLRKASLCTVIGTLVLALSLNVGALCYGARNIYVLTLQSDEGEEIPQNGETVEEPASGGHETEKTAENTHDPTGPLRFVKELFPEYFPLSFIKNSAMLLLFEEISPDGTITASGLAICGQELSVYLEQCAHPRMFYTFYEGLEPLFPKGNKDSSFEDVSTYEESMAQIRGAGAELKDCRDSDDPQKIYDACHHLAIRSKDALYFGKEEGVLTVQMTWVLGEIAFAALINESVYGDLAGPALSDWYYRMAQIFEYIGDIADEKELRLQLYYVAAVSYYCAYEQISSRGLPQAGGSYGGDIWDAYFEMVYKVAVRTNNSLRKDFFMIILEGEMDVETSGLSDAVIKKTQEKLEGLKRYWTWKELSEGIAAARELEVRREEGHENA